MQTEATQVSVAMLELLLEELGDETPEDLTNEVLAVRSIEFLIKRIIGVYGKNINKMNDKEFCICALFVFILAEYIATCMFELDVEELTVVVFITTFAKHQNSNRLMDMYRDSTDAYNAFSRTQPKSIEVARTVLVGCIVGPYADKSLSTAPKVFKSLVDCLD